MGARSQPAMCWEREVQHPGFNFIEETKETHGDFLRIISKKKHQGLQGHKMDPWTCLLTIRLYSFPSPKETVHQKRENNPCLTAQLSLQPSTAGYSNLYAQSSFKCNHVCFDWFYMYPQTLVQHWLQETAALVQHGSGDLALGLITDWSTVSTL